MSKSAEPVSVYGAGSWGTALALQLARHGNRVHLWGHDAQHMQALHTQRENRRYLPGIPLPDNLSCHTVLSACAAQADLHLVVVPSHGFYSLLEALKPCLRDRACLIWASKGLDGESGQLLHQLVNAVLPDLQRYGVLSGPSFAAEVARSLPTAITLATTTPTLSREVASVFHGPDFRVYTSADITGVELGGVVKNVLAIAAGLSDGLGFGANARTALITRGLAEMRRLGEALGAQPETLAGLAGLGDLVLTCTDDQSRNRRFGLALGQGQSRSEATATIGQVVEGVKAAAALQKLTRQVPVEMPICQSVYRILYKDLSPRQAVQELLSRDLKAEF